MSSLAVVLPVRSIAVLIATIVSILLASTILEMTTSAVLHIMVTSVGLVIHIMVLEETDHGGMQSVDINWSLLLLLLWLLIVF